MANIQHVVTRNGPPTEAPPSFGAHYIDLLTKRQWISTGVQSAADWGDPVGELLPRGGLPGQIVKWVNGGAVWVDYDQGVSKSYVDQQDIATLAAAEAKVDVVIANADLILQTDVDAKDALVLQGAKDYFDTMAAQAGKVPVGGTTGQVLAKTSNADGAVTWVTMADPGVSQATADAAFATERQNTIAKVNNINQVPPGGLAGEALVSTGVGGNGAFTWKAPNIVAIRNPDIFSPTDGSTVPSLVTFDVGPFSPAYTYDTRTVREIQVDVATGDYSNPIFTASANQDSWTVQLSSGTSYKWRVRDKSNVGDVSFWSNGTFSTAAAYVQSSISVNVGVDGYAPYGPTLSTGFATIGGSADTQVATDWVVVREDGTIEWSSLNDSINLTSVTIPTGILDENHMYTFKSRVKGATYGWGPMSTTTAAVKREQYLVVPYGSSPFISIYSQDLDTFTKLPDPSTLPPAAALCARYSPSGTYLAIGASSGSPAITIYKRTGTTYTKLSTPYYIPPTACYAIAFDPTETYMAAVGATNYLTIYRRSGDVFVKLTNPTTLPTGVGYGVSFDVTSTYLAVSHASAPYVSIYKRAEDTFTKLADPASLPTSVGTDCGFSADGSFLAISLSASPYLMVYKHDGDAFNSVTLTTLPAGSATGVNFSPNGNYLAVSHDTAPYMTVFSRNGLTFTKIVDPVSLPQAVTNGVRFSPDSQYLAVAASASPYLMIYKMVNGTLTKLPDPQIVPGSAVSKGLSWFYFT